MPEPTAETKKNFSRFQIKLSRQADGRLNTKWLLMIISAAVFLLLLIIALIIFLFEAKYAQEFFPGSRLGPLSLEGLTQEQALNLLGPLTQKIESDGVKVVYQKNNDSALKFTSTINGLSGPDLSREILNYDNSQTILAAFAYARSGNWLQNLPLQFNQLIFKKHFYANYYLDEATLLKLLKQQFNAEEQPFTDARPQIDCLNNPCQINILPEQSGLTFDYAKLINDLKTNLANLNNQTIELKLTVSQPEITLVEALSQKGELEKILAQEPPKFTYQQFSWQMSKNVFGQMLEFQKQNSQITVGLNLEQFNGWLDKNIAGEINIPAQNATVEIKNGQIIKLSAHQEGLIVDEAAVYQNFLTSILTNQTSTPISVKKVEPEVVTEDINNLGIKEIIGIGESNFAGSPVNRRKNIKNGASKLHGLLIKPDEEFSLINALGAIDASTGYLPELVIKGNKTTPEYGGGLCQIGTTMFRAALASGLPITERQSHSYNVTYYLEDGLPGVDATIYIPHPDVKFISDTGNYILIQAKISGDKLSFEFWGAKDGRTATKTKPQVWGWVAPPATKYIETTELAVGAKKCTENSHKGVNASFDYLVVMPDGEERKQTFTSHYKPWQAVCLIGVEKLPDSGNAATNGDNGNNPATGGSSGASQNPASSTAPQI